MNTTEQKTEPIHEPEITERLIRRVRAHLAGKHSKGKTSPAKRKASRENGKKGGRPKRSQLEMNLRANP